MTTSVMCTKCNGRGKVATGLLGWELCECGGSGMVTGMNMLKQLVNDLDESDRRGLIDYIASTWPKADNLNPKTIIHFSHPVTIAEIKEMLSEMNKSFAISPMPPVLMKDDLKVNGGPGVEAFTGKGGPGPEPDAEPKRMVGGERNSPELPTSPKPYTRDELWGLIQDIDEAIADGLPFHLQALGQKGN